MDDLPPSAVDPRAAETDLPEEDEPNTTGTLFLTLVFLMLIGGFWVILYRILLNR